MKRRTTILIVACLLFSSVFVSSCEWAQGYFHQVTVIKGQVVGKSLWLTQWRWLRQSFSVTNAELILFKYPDAYSPLDKLPKPVARTRTDSKGWFDFGTVPRGRYTLIVRSGELSDWFDVEVTPTVPATDYVKVDVSPNRPDCTGGHEFIVRKKS
jgi:hypothetical protein